MEDKLNKMKEADRFEDVVALLVKENIKTKVVDSYNKYMSHLTPSGYPRFGFVEDEFMYQDNDGNVWKLDMGEWEAVKVMLYLARSMEDKE